MIRQEKAILMPNADQPKLTGAPRRATLPNQRYSEQQGMGKSHPRLDTVQDEDEYYQEDEQNENESEYNYNKRYGRNEVMDLDF